MATRFTAEADLTRKYLRESGIRRFRVITVQSVMEDYENTLKTKCRAVKLNR